MILWKSCNNVVKEMTVPREKQQSLPYSALLELQLGTSHNRLH